MEATVARLKAMGADVVATEAQLKDEIGGAVGTSLRAG
jgi:hypothetical protein